MATPRIDIPREHRGASGFESVDFEVAGSVVTEEPLTLLTGPAPAGARRRRSLQGGRLWWHRALDTGVLASVVIMGVAGALRLVFPNAYDVLGDEIYYTDLSSAVRAGHYPPHFQNQGVFLLHPPLFFLIGALWQMLIGPVHGYFALVDSMRLLETIFAIITAGLLVGIGTRLASWRVGAIAGGFFALDPYALRTNGRVLLETPAICLVLAGYLVLLGLTRDHRARLGVPTDQPRKGSLWIAAAAGLLFGLSIVALELDAIVTVLPLAVLLWRNWCIERRYVALALVVALLPYAGYLVSLAVTHNLGDFFSQDLLGLKRALGLVKETGFNAAKAPSLVATLTGEAPQFAPTYLLVAAGVGCSIHPLLQRKGDLRLFAVVTLTGALAIAYEAVFGTIEEQFLYILLVPGLVAVACAVSTSLGLSRPAVRRVMRPVVFLLVAAVLSYDFAVWAEVRSQPDNGLQALAEYVSQDLPHHGTVATDVLVATYALEHVGVSSISISGPAAARHHHVRYLAILSAELVGGYGSLDQAQAAWFAKRGHLVFSLDEATYQKVLVYETNNPAIW